MAFYIGNTKISKVYVGATQIVSAYVGSAPIFEETSAYVTFTAKQANSSIGLASIATAQTLEYRTNGSSWASMTTATTVSLANSGDTVCVRGVLSSDNTGSNYTQFTMSGNIKASGNINYLWNSDPTEPLKEYCGRGLFSGCTALSDVTELELPSTEVSNGGYYEMFNSCSSLVTAPTLPATTLGGNCYRGMFRGCTLLATAPALPATTLVGVCYRDMFAGCTSLTTAPTLTATTLALRCYQGMFNGCTSLTAAPELPATTLATGCYNGMFSGCTALVYAPTELPAITLNSECYQYMFAGCTSLTTAPRVLFDAWDSSFVSGMFSGCSNLNYIECLASSQTGGQLTNWVAGVSANGTFIKKSGATWVIGNDGIPSGWTVFDDVPPLIMTSKQSNSTVGLSKLSRYQAIEYTTDNITWDSMTTATTITLANSGDIVYFRGVLAYHNDNNTTYTTFTTSGNIKVSGNLNYMFNYQNVNAELKKFCAYSLFRGCTGLTDASDLRLPSSAAIYHCYDNMFYGCSSLVNSPRILPATTLGTECYYEMFSRCSSLITTPKLVATSLAESCYSSMFERCTSLTSAPALPSTTLANYCYKSMFQSCSKLEKAPELLATTLAKSCYQYMFSSCSKLKYVKCLAVNRASNDTSGWLSAVSASGDFYKAAGSTWASGNDGIPSGWTVHEV